MATLMLARNGSDTGNQALDLVPGTPLPPFRSRKDCLDIETLPGRFVLAKAPDFIDDGVPQHDLFSHEFFWRADNRTLAGMAHGR